MSSGIRLWCRPKLPYGGPNYRTEPDGASSPYDLNLHQRRQVLMTRLGPVAADVADAQVRVAGFHTSTGCLAGPGRGVRRSASVAD